jgi:2-hydroxychromene-2-carboxylate isomerase
MQPINTSKSPPQLELWFEFGSNYSYLSVMRIEELARKYHVNVAWRPFLLGPIFKSFGWDSSPFVLQKEKGIYVWQDMARQCAKYGLEWKKPSQFPRRALLPMRVAMLGVQTGWMAEFCRQIMQQNFAADREIDSPELVTEVLTALGLPAAEIISEAQSDLNKQRLRDQTSVAQSRGIFGAPTLFVGDEMFWGNDRLEDAMSFAAGTKTPK